MMNYETLKQANHVHVESLGGGLNVLANPDGVYEYWQASRYFAGYALIWKNTHLEYCSLANDYSPPAGWKDPRGL